MVQSLAVKLNITKKRAEILFTALALIVLMLAMIPATRAFFEAGTNVDVAVSFGNADTSFEYSLDGSALRNPGDSQELTLRVRNQGNIPLRYFFTIERDTEASRLAAYLGVYWDDEYLGMLSELTTGRLGTFDEGASIPAFVPAGADTLDDQRFFIVPGDSQEHTLRFEYHIGASAIDAAEARSARINVRGYAETIHLENETVIYNADDFEQVVLLSNFGKLTQNRVIVGADIDLGMRRLTLDGANASTGALHLDLNGHTLNMSAAQLTVKDGTSGSGILILHDSCGDGSITGSSSFTLQGSGAYIAGEGLAGYSGRINTTAYSPSAETLSTLYEGYIRPQAQAAVKGGVQSGETNSFIRGYGAYGNALSISAQSYVGYNQSAGTITPTAERNMNGVVNIGGRALIFEIIGSLGADSGREIDEVVSEIETKYLSYLTSGIVYYDVLLPTRLKGYNCHIEWYSSDPATLDETGNYTSPWVDTPVTLQAIYTINDFRAVRTYEVTVKGYSYEEKMSYYLAHIGAIEFNLLPQDHQLWDKDSYKDVGACGRDLNITNVSYSIPGQNPGDTDNFTGFLQFAGDGGMALRLYSISNTFLAYINVTVTFDAPPELVGTTADGDNVITRQIAVIIDLDDYTTADDILKYVQSSIMAQTVPPSAQTPSWEVPVDLYDRMSCQSYGYPRTLRLPAYYEATAYAYDENGDLFEYTAGFHPIEYIIPNDVTGAGDSDGDYDVAKTGTLEIEYTNTSDALSAARLVSSGVQTIEGRTASTSGIAYYDLTIDISKLKSDNQDLNIIVSLDTPFAGKENSIGDWIDSTPQDRRNLQFLLPGILRADMFDESDVSHGQEVFGHVRSACIAAGLPDAHTSYVFTRDVASVHTLSIENCYLSDDNLWPLKYFTGLTTLDISGAPSPKNSVGNSTVVILQKLTNLEHLDIANCSITDIDPLETLTNLEHLDISGNSGINHVTVIANFCDNLSYMNAEGTACEELYNEWAYAYAFFKYRDAHSGAKPTILKADGSIYEPPFALWQYPEAYRQYRKLVYTNAEYTEIGQASKSAGYVWLPKVMLESRTANGFTADGFFGTGWEDYWARGTNNVTVNERASEDRDGIYEGWQIDLSNARVGNEVVVGHVVRTTSFPTTVYDPETDTTSNTTVSVSSARCFFFDVVQ